MSGSTEAADESHQPSQLKRPAVDLPEEYRDHPLIVGRVFLTLPEALLTKLEEHLGKDAFDPDLWKVERALSSLCGDHTEIVGFWRARKVFYARLRRAQMDCLPIDQALLDVMQWNLTVEQVEHRLKIGERRSQWIDQVAKGYAGWLMTNPVFLDEHDRLLAKYHKAIEKWGLPTLPRATTKPVLSERQEELTSELKDFCDAMTEFQLGWRLSGLAAPNLPVPLSPMTPVSAPIVTIGPMAQAGAFFFLPDIYPIPSRDQLRGILDESLRASAPERLADWAKLVTSDNKAKNQIARFARIFEIQHYCRILQSRHPDALHRRKDDLERALADYFLHVKEATIRRDLLFINRRLGPNWMNRGSQTEGGRTPEKSPSAARRKPR